MIKRTGCLLCGRFVMDLDEQKARLRIAIAKHSNSPTAKNRATVEQIRENFHTAQKLYNEHMTQHAKDE